MNTKKFKPGKRITIFFVFFALLFFVLGLWQIERGQAKTGIIEEFNANLESEPQYLDDQAKKWDRVFVKGTWENSRQILIDNVIKNKTLYYKKLNF